MTAARAAIPGARQRPAGQHRWLRAARYLWPIPYTLLGLVFGLLCVRSGARARWVDGVLEIHGAAIRKLFQQLDSDRLSIRAITLGHVVLGRDGACLQGTRRHERVHVEQYERWGPFFLPAYLIAAVAAARTGGDPYLDNYFERQATRASRGPSVPCSLTARQGKSPLASSSERELAATAHVACAIPPRRGLP